jgi:hypothetical protein
LHPVLDTAPPLAPDYNATTTIPASNANTSPTVEQATSTAQ